MKNNAAKQKSIIIDGDMHGKFKNLCKARNMKIGAVTEDLILLYINKRVDVEKMIDSIKKDV